ncbi:MAG: hypothetical protein V3R89_07030, partial [Thermoanaerobaculia bacterium]
MSDATAKTLSDIKRQLCGVILGKDEALDHVLVALLAGRPTGDTPLTRLSGKLDFDVQFSGSEVRLLALRKSADSDCSGTSVEGSGSGTADASYPDATRAEGTCQLGYTLPGRNDRRATPRCPVTGPVLASVVGTLRLVAGLTG